MEEKLLLKRVKPINKHFFHLHLAMMIYAIAAVFSKLASNHHLFSGQFFVFYTLSISLVLIYAFLWQLVLRHISLSVAFANKAITVLWGVVFGKVLFQESIRFGMLLGTAIIILGIYLVVSSDE